MPQRIAPSNAEDSRCKHEYCDQCHCGNGNRQSSIAAAICHHLNHYPKYIWAETAGFCHSRARDDTSPSRRSFAAHPAPLESRSGVGRQTSFRVFHRNAPLGNKGLKSAGWHEGPVHVCRAFLHRGIPFKFRSRQVTVRPLPESSPCDEYCQEQHHDHWQYHRAELRNLLYRLDLNSKRTRFRALRLY